jgi:glyoxylase I family protein
MAGSAPARLHHTAWVSRDLEATRHFYEDLVGLPLVATWTERDDTLRPDMEYAHAFFGLAEGGALAFFQFADDADYEKWKPPAIQPNPFAHVALKVDGDQQAAIGKRLGADGVDNLTVDHGFCRSLYATDPDGFLVELTVDVPNASEIDAGKARSAHDDLRAWLAGDHTPNNVHRNA